MKTYTDQKLMRLDELTGLIQGESHRQLGKWGTQAHTIFEWLTYLGEEVGEICKAVCEYEYRNGSREDIISETIEAATLALKIAEMYIAETDPEIRSVYLAGPIFDCCNFDMRAWRQLAKTELKGIKIIDPCDFGENQPINITDSLDLIVDPDKEAIDKCQIVLANCWKPSVGTSMEILYACERGKMVISVVPEGDVSAWIFAHSDIVFHNIEQAVKFVNDMTTANKGEAS